MGEDKRSVWAEKARMSMAEPSAAVQMPEDKKVSMWTLIPSAIALLVLIGGILWLIGLGLYNKFFQS